MHKLLLILVFCGLFACQSKTQQATEPAISPNAERFYDQHPAYRVNGLETRRFKLEDIEPMIKALPDVMKGVKFVDEGERGLVLKPGHVGLQAAMPREASR